MMPRMTQIFLFLTAMALLGCEQKAPSVEPKQTVDSDSPVSIKKAEYITLSGDVRYPGSEALPPGATVRVVLEDVSRQDVAAPVIAEQLVHPESSQPFAFRLRYPASAVDATPKGYAVRAEIRNAAGDLLWTTTRRHSVDVGRDADSDPVVVTLEKVGETRQNQADLSPAARKARQQGASFWATGNEPGWHLAIYPEDKLVLVTDYGETRLETPDSGAVMEQGTTLYRVTTEQADLRVELKETPCQDDMSGQAFPYQVKVTRNDSAFTGCGLDI